ALGCDVLVAPVRKHLRGPRGLALAYVRAETVARLTPAFVDTLSAPVGQDGVAVPHTGAQLLESSEKPVALVCGLANALQEALDVGVDAIRARVVPMAAPWGGRSGGFPAVPALARGAGGRGGGRCARGWCRSTSTAGWRQT